jgi:hypothetical protein
LGLKSKLLSASACNATKHLWERLCAFENLAAAAREALLAKRGKHAGTRFFAEWERVARVIGGP